MQNTTLKTTLLLLALMTSACGAGGSAESGNAASAAGGLHEGIFTSSGPNVGAPNGLSYIAGYATNDLGYKVYRIENDTPFYQSAGFLSIPADFSGNPDSCLFRPDLNLQIWSQYIDVENRKIAIATDRIENNVTGTLTCDEYSRLVVLDFKAQLENQTKVLRFDTVILGSAYFLEARDDQTELEIASNNIKVVFAEEEAGVTPQFQGATKISGRERAGFRIEVSSAISRTKFSFFGLKEDAKPVPYPSVNFSVSGTTPLSP